MSTVFILGAGATAGTKGLPVDRDFLQKSSNVINSYYFLPSALDFLYSSSWFGQRLEEAWSKIDVQYNSPPSISSELTGRILKLFEKKATGESGPPTEERRYYKRYWQERIKEPQKRSPAQYLFLFAGWELRQAICRVYGQAIAGGEAKYRELLTEYADRRPVSVIDFNYDLYFEEALNNQQWFYYPEPSPGDAMEILKPHGSLNWVHRNVWRQDEEIVVNRDGVFPVASWGWGLEGFSQASIIPMARAKREFTPNEESRAIRCRYGKILHRCEDVLKQAQHICVVGYSFPPGDQHFKDILYDVRTGRVTPLRNLKYISKDSKDSTGSWTAKLRKVFGVTFDPEVRLDGF